MKKKAFTLIELVAVLVILAILSLIVTPLVMNIIRKAKDSANKRSIDGYGKAADLAIANYLLKHYSYPDSFDKLEIEYTGSHVECKINRINLDETIYLSECTVNGEIVKDSNTEDGWYHYGSIVIPAAEELITKANATSVTNYTDGNIKEMYTFSHPATTQTGELTDYRYIGANPNNYVTFNNELWRIIGVFTVEDESGKLEQRIKIVRNEKLPDNMAWDANDVNEWSTATLNKYLNEDYYNILDKKSKNMIANTKYYLGGGIWSSATHYGTAEDMYNWERGNTVSTSDRSTFWNGKIALMYPSDYTYTYSLGVDNICYTDAKKCHSTENGKPKTSWIYNTNSNSTQCLLSPYSVDIYYSFIVNIQGNVGNNNSKNLNSVRPSLYLSSNVKITSGDGTEQNPYQLKL